MSQDENTTDRGGGAWNLITGHGVVLLYVAANPDATVRKIAADTEMTERRATGIIRDLVESGMLTVRHEGRSNRYAVNLEARFRRPFLSRIPLRRFVAMLREDDA